MRASIAFTALSAQIGAAFLVFSTFKAASFFGLTLGFWTVVVLHGSAAVLLSKLLHLPWWWLFIQGLFVPAVFLTLSLHVPSSFFLAGFILIWMFYFSNIKERVPLYFTNEATAQALKKLLPKQKNFHFLDLGSGLGGVVTYLAERNPNGIFQGVESAPALFLISWLRLRKKFNANVRYGNIWRENLKSYDVVYAFLSPDAMPELWCKAKQEMRKGSLFVSNTFAVPGEKPTKTLQLTDTRRTRLMIWKM